MHKTDDTKIGDIIFSLNSENIIEWEIIGINPNNKRYFIILNKETNEIRQIHWKTEEYGTEEKEFFSLSEAELFERYKKRTSYVISHLYDKCF